MIRPGCISFLAKEPAWHRCDNRRGLRVRIPQITRGRQPFCRAIFLPLVLFIDKNCWATPEQYRFQNNIHTDTYTPTTLYYTGSKYASFWRQILIIYWSWMMSLNDVLMTTECRKLLTSSRERHFDVILGCFQAVLYKISTQVASWWYCHFDVKMTNNVSIANSMDHNSTQ